MSRQSTWTPPRRTAPIRYNSLPFDRPLMLAPLEGVSHSTFREMIAEHGGLGIVCTEFVRITSNPVSEKQMARQVVKAPGLPLSVQVMGTDVDRMQDAARLVAAAGADVVDINLGCPAPRVVKKGAGSAMLKNPELLFEVLSAMREEVGGVLSAKIRAGFDEADSVVRNARTLEAAGADYIVVHPRRRCDFYKGVSDWRIVRTLKESLEIPVVGNGDVWYAEDALRMMRETGCDGVMIGRPALRNPWIFQQIAALMDDDEPVRPTGRDVVDWMNDVAVRYEEAFPELKHGPIGKMKELLTYLGRAVPDDMEFRRTVLRKQSIPEVLEYCEEKLGWRSAEEMDLLASPLHGLEKSGSADPEVLADGNAA
jgi:nifR3 family TIM-barrel protein